MTLEAQILACNSGRKHRYRNGLCIHCKASRSEVKSAKDTAYRKGGGFTLKTDPSATGYEAFFAGVEESASRGISDPEIRAEWLSGFWAAAKDVKRDAVRRVEGAVQMTLVIPTTSLALMHTLDAVPEYVTQKMQTFAQQHDGSRPTAYRVKHDGQVPGAALTALRKAFVQAGINEERFSERLKP